MTNNNRPEILHSNFHGMCPAYLSNTVEPIGADCTCSRLCSTSKTDFSLPWLRTPEDLRNMADPAKFKKQLKTYFFTSTFNAQCLLNFPFLMFCQTHVMQLCLSCNRYTINSQTMIMTMMMINDGCQMQWHPTLTCEAAVSLSADRQCINESRSKTGIP